MNISHVGIYGIVLKESSILLIQKARGPFTGLWDLPGGKIEHGETLEQALSRELYEEGGVIIHQATLIDGSTNLVKFIDERGFISMHHIGLFYLITDYEIEQKERFDMQEVKALKWHAITELHTQELTPFATHIMKKLKENL